MNEQSVLFNLICSLSQLRARVGKGSLGHGSPRQYFGPVWLGHGAMCQFHQLFMAALHSRCRHYIFVPFLLHLFLPRLILAVADCMSTILLHMVWL